MNALNDYPNRKTIEAMAEKYSLCLPERQQVSLMGELSGKRTGSSIEYQDRKNYVPGDDIRHVDWRAYARTDRLTIKLYREEICPTVDLIVDTTSSMAVTTEKATRRFDLTFLFYLLAQKLHATIRLYSLSNRLERIFNPFDLLQTTDVQHEAPLSLLRESPAVRRGGIKILISDLLFPFSPKDLIRLFTDADRCVIVQVLTQFEDDPYHGGEIRLQDAETDMFLDIRLDRATLDGYKQRLNHLREDLERQLTVAGGTFCVTRDLDSLEETMLRLLRASVVEV